MNWPLVMLIAFAIEAAIGWPTRLHAQIGHPVTWIGGLVSRLDHAWNKPQLDPGRNRLAGTTATVVTVLAATLPPMIIAFLLHPTFWGHLLAGALAAPLLATRSLYTHVAAVAVPLEHGQIADARAAVSQIVGRDPAQLDQSGIARASLESLAENTSDGVIAPLFWGALLGLPGIAAYKAINTLDSMIGHRSPRHEHFGWFAAKLDDLVNWPAARLTGVLIALAGGRPARCLRTMRADAPHHRSPNAGWPEAAMAASLDCRLSGPRFYQDRVAQEPWINASAPDPAPGDLLRGLGLYKRTMFLAGALLCLLAAA
ncbi:adenosylcobinamide-phosphate synthase CbiB [Amaricoccus macauensis]|uniref:adenosylcobinamide-phosphate synthase CbiB n=1 Tax=Amaricoccus macauensis TaxID=57001 RepID=UPI003C7CDB0C